jgi:hypothetical protein
VNTASPHQQARDHQQVRVDRPLQAGDGGMEVTPDRRHGHVDDRDIQPDDEQAQAADGQYQVPAAAAQLGQVQLLVQRIVACYN